MRLRRHATPDVEVDVDEVLTSLLPDPEVESLIRSAAGISTSAIAAVPTQVLDAPVVAIVAWSRESHVLMYDGGSRCIAVVPTLSTSRRLRTAATVQCRDRSGTSFTMRAWSRGDRPFGLHTRLADVTWGMSLDRLGVVDKQDAGRLLDADGELLGSIERHTRRWRGRDAVLLSPDRHALATISWTTGGRTRTRHYNSLHVVEFTTMSTPQIRALTLAVVLYDVLALFRDWED